MNEQHARTLLTAVAMAAMLVLAPVAGTVAVSGPAAAASFSADEADASIESGNTFWQGQSLWLEADTLAGLEAGDTLQIRKVNADEQLTGLMTEFVLEENGTAVIETASLNASDYVVTTGTDGVVEFNATGHAVSVASTTDEGAVESAAWEIAGQTLSARFEEDDLPVRTGQTARIRIDSNRGEYTLNVSSPDLDEDDLETVFGQPGDQADAFDEASLGNDDGVIQLENATASSTLVANFTELEETGELSFEFDVAETTADGTAGLTVSDRDVTLGFDQDVYKDQVGDEVPISLALEDADRAWLFVGGEEVNYLERLELVDADDDGRVTVELNAFEVGREAFDQARPDHASTVGADAAYSVREGDRIASITRFNDTGSAIEVAPVLTTPLEADSYLLSLSSSPAIVTTGEDAGAVSDERAVATLALTEREGSVMQSRVAPGGDADLDGAEFRALMERSTPSRTVAIGAGADRVLLRVHASGVYGYLAEEEISALVAGGQPNHGLNLTVRQVHEDINEAPDELDLTGDGVGLQTDPANETFTVVLDMSDVELRDGGDLEDGETYQAVFQIGVIDNDVGVDYDGADEIQENPYVPADEERVATAEFTVVEADAEVRGLSDGTLRVSQVDNVTIRGSTTVAPHQTVTVTAKTEDDHLLLRRDEATVRPDGTWAASFEFADVPVGTTFTASVGIDAAQLGSAVDGRVLEEPRARLAFLDQESPGAVVEVQSVTLSRGGFIVLHRGSASGPVVGVSELLGSGTHEAVRIVLDEPVEGSTTLVAVPHRDENADNRYHPETDEAYVDNGSIVTDMAVITYAEAATPTATVSDEPTPIVVTKTVQVESPTPQVVTETVVVTTTATPGQPGFGAFVALLALLGGGWLVARRR